MRTIDINWKSNRDLVALLSESGARFLVVGGTAVLFHAPERRASDDLDLLIDPSLETAEKVFAAMAHLGGPRILATPGDLALPGKQLREKTIFYLDVLTPPADFPFAEHWASAEEATIAAAPTRVRVASIPTLQLLLRHTAKFGPLTEKHARDMELLARAAHQESP